MSKKMIPNDDILIDLYVNKKMFIREICRIYGLSENSSGNISLRLRKLGVDIRQMKGENHNCWKGGRISKGDNYIGIWNPNHERSDNQGYVYEHTLVIEKSIGRLPNGKEVIHHIDLDKKNNNIENLHLFNDDKEHAVCHRSMETLIKPLLERNIIKFEDGVYKIML